MARGGGRRAAERARREGLASLAAEYEFVHGSAEVPEALMELLGVRKQQIGQLEILAKLVSYVSLAEHWGAQLRGCDVMHWGDNSSAVAAAVKGYSGVPDSARLVHALHATLAGLDEAKLEAMNAVLVGIFAVLLLLVSKAPMRVIPAAIRMRRLWF